MKLSLEALNPRYALRYSAFSRVNWALWVTCTPRDLLL